jgi:hypothetical protein
VPGALVTAAEQVAALQGDGAPATGVPEALAGAIPPITLGGGGARSLSSYGGPHGAITLLYESLRQRDPRIGIERRARMHYAAMEGLGRYVAQNRAKVTETVAMAGDEMISKGSRWDAADSIWVEWEPYVTRTGPYNVVVDDGVVELEVPIRDGRRPVFGRIRPEGYLIEAHRGDIAEHLALHGVAVERLLEPASVEVESYRVESVTRSDPNEGFIPRDFTVTIEAQTIDVPAGTWVARAGQKRAGILFHLMEPEDNDSYAAGGWFINNEGIGDQFPVHRIRTLPRVPMQVRTAEDFR